VLQWMVDVSGLPVNLIGTLYRMEPVAKGEGPGPEAGDENEHALGLDAGNAASGERSTGR
jgi:hypothetical protein